MRSETLETEAGPTGGEAWTLANFSEIIHRGGVGLWAWVPERRLARLDALCREFWGTTETFVGIDELFSRVNAEDRAPMMDAWAASATNPQPYSFDFRIGEGIGARWISARGVGGDAGRVGDWLHAIFLDVTERKRAEEAEKLLTAELAHRVSNMFSVARALTNIVAREATSVPGFTEDLSRRFTVLHEATTLAIRSRKLDAGTVPLQDLAERILAPYRDGAEIRIAIGDDAVVTPDRVNDYAMIFHELATNSAKYGCLSCGGALTLNGGVASRVLSLTWKETVAQAVEARSEGSGFGSRLLRQTIERSLGGRFNRVIDGNSLHFEMTVPAA
ncbi:sensor histidine kinase [Methylobacterium persicinum]|uniref:histidine kinase n=1 Tax=Methylobacterium persicinum TaxID=374426 RepID=A0ABU0HK25_9HYPH|nr:sensor histidine kinase [Methylobacterium persicinum]MDQ0442672.1 two-component sensor histidine kinase [Methylobacterium persicinum]GJE37081.1 Blue-light-activated histidine kinase [Methylobacterium persicinum]